MRSLTTRMWSKFRSDARSVRRPRRRRTMTKETLERSVPNAGNRAKVFISYSRKDLAFAQMLVDALGERGFDAFLDKTDIAPGEPWKERLGGLIAAADTVVFVISPNSVASSVCAWELEESARLGKRLIPVVARRIADADAPPALGRLNWVFCTEGDDKEAALAALDTALHTDLPWVREHTRLGELARHWDEQKRSRGATLRGADLDAAERWLDRRPADANAPTDLHQDFIRASRRAATGRQRMWVGGSLAVAILAIGLAIFAEVNRREAQAQRDRAEHTLRSRPRRPTASSSTSPRNSEMSCACPQRRSRTSSTGRANCRTSCSDRARRAKICAAARPLALTETAITLQSARRQQGRRRGRHETGGHPSERCSRTARRRRLPGRISDRLRAHRRRLRCSGPFAGGAASLPVGLDIPARMTKSAPTTWRGKTSSPM